MDDEAKHAAELDLAARYAAWATLSPAGKTKHHDGVLFKVPHKTDPLHLVPAETVKAGMARPCCAFRRKMAAARGLRAHRCGHGI